MAFVFAETEGPNQDSSLICDGLWASSQPCATVEGAAEASGLLGAREPRLRCLRGSGRQPFGHGQPPRLRSADMTVTPVVPNSSVQFNQGRNKVWRL